MRAVVLYRPSSEQSRQTESYALEFNRQHPGKEVELLDVDTAEGQHLAQLYDAVRFPAVLALSGDGTLLQIWQDGQLPLAGELEFYAQAG